MDKRIIFLDIDGTLTEPGCNEVPESALRAIEQARKNGHDVFLCTGRSYGMILPLLQYDFNGVIASAGSYIECCGEVIVDCPIGEEQQRIAMSVLKENGVFRTVECMDGCYADEEFTKYLQANVDDGANSELLRWRKQTEKSLNVFPMRAYNEQPIYKIVIACLSWEQLDQPRKMLDSEFVFSIPGEDQYGFINGELINRRYNKGKAVERICDHLHIPITHSVAFGDSINDREMLETAGLGICMQNGSEELKKIADDVCPSVKEDGIMQAFMKHHLI